MANEHAGRRQSITAAVLLLGMLAELATAQTATRDVGSAATLKAAIADDSVEFIRLTRHLTLELDDGTDAMLGGPIARRLAIWGYCQDPPGPEFILPNGVELLPQQCIVNGQVLGRLFVIQVATGRLSLSNLVLQNSNSAGKSSGLKNAVSPEINGEGGTVLALPGSRLYMRDVTVAGSFSGAKPGGALSFRSAQGRLTQVQFYQNDSTDNGGAIATGEFSQIVGGEAARSEVYIFESIFRENRADRLAANLYLDKGSTVYLEDASLLDAPADAGPGARGISWAQSPEPDAVSLRTDYSHLLVPGEFAPITALPTSGTFRDVPADDVAFIARVDQERASPAVVTLAPGDTTTSLAGDAGSVAGSGTVPVKEPEVGPPVAAIAGGIAGVLLLIAAALGAFYCWRKRQREHTSKDDALVAPEHTLAMQTHPSDAGDAPMHQLADGKVVVVTRHYTGTSTGGPGSMSDIPTDGLSVASDNTFGTMPSGFTTDAAGATVLGLDLVCTRRPYGDESVHKMPAIEARKTATALDHIRLVLGGAFDGYTLDKNEKQEAGGQALVALATSEHGMQVAIKMFDDARAFEREVEVYKVLSKWGGKQDQFLLDVRDGVAEPRVLRPGLPMPSYIVMRRGESMQHWIVRRAPEPMRALWMLGEVSSQLKAMHEAGFVHRDIKPANILWLQDSSQWRLIDFGSASRTNELSEPSFTLRFAAPEAISEVHAANKGRREGVAAGVASSAPMMTTAHASEDVWAMGVIAFELFSGRPFYDDKSDTNMIKAMLLGEAPFPYESDPDVFVAMGRCGPVVRCMLDRDPKQRLTVSAVLKQLQSILR